MSFSLVKRSAAAFAFKTFNGVQTRGVTIPVQRGMLSSLTPYVRKFCSTTTTTPTGEAVEGSVPEVEKPLTTPEFQSPEPTSFEASAPPPIDRTPEQRSIAPSTVFIGGLSWDTRHDNLKTTFEQLGLPVVTSEVLINRETGNSRGFGFVRFVNSETAQMAVEKMNGQDIDGRLVTVRLTTGRTSDARGFNGDSSTVFVGDLSPSVTNSGLYEAFRSIGNIVTSRLLMDRETGSSRGFGFVDFTDVASAKRAVEQMDGQQIDGQSVRVKMTTQRPVTHMNNAEPTPTIMVRGIPYDSPREALVNVFGKHNPVSIRIPMDHETGMPRGFAFVQFNSVEASQAALEEASVFIQENSAFQTLILKYAQGRAVGQADGYRRGFAGDSDFGSDSNNFGY